MHFCIQIVKRVAMPFKNSWREGIVKFPSGFDVMTFRLVFDTLHVTLLRCLILQVDRKRVAVPMPFSRNELQIKRKKKTAQDVNLFVFMQRFFKEAYFFFLILNFR